MLVTNGRRRSKPEIWEGIDGGRGWRQNRSQSPACWAECQLATAFSTVRAKSSVWVCIRKIADSQHKILPAGLAELWYKCVVYQGKSILWCQEIVGVALIMF